VKVMGGLCKRGPNKPLQGSLNSGVAAVSTPLNVGVCRTQEDR
jgi:hypothetical protein